MHRTLVPLRRGAVLVAFSLPISGCGMLLADSIGFLRVQAASQTPPTIPEDVDPGEIGVTPPEIDDEPPVDDDGDDGDIGVDGLTPT